MLDSDVFLGNLPFIYYSMSSREMLLLLLSCFSHVQLFATPWTVAHQTILSMGFSRQEYWSGLPCPCPRIETLSHVSCIGRRVLYD